MTKLSLIIPFVVAALITGYFYIAYRSIFTPLSLTGFQSSAVIDTPDDDTAFGWVFAQPEINDSLPHRVYRRLEDSVKQKINLHQNDNKSSGVEAISFGLLGTAKLHNSWNEYISSTLINYDSVRVGFLNSIFSLNERQDLAKDSGEYKMIRDSITMMQTFYLQYAAKQKQKYKDKKPYSYYLSISGYLLDYNTKFFVKNGTFNLAYPMWGNSKIEKPASVIAGHYEQKRIQVRYSVEDKKILVPVSEGRYKILKQLFAVAGWVSMFLYFFFAAGLPLLILINISRGKAFIKQNVKLFRYIALYFFATFLIAVFTPYLIHKYYEDIIPNDFTMQPFLNNFFEEKNRLFQAIGFYIVSFAFKRGYKLQQEQSLTI